MNDMDMVDGKKDETKPGEDVADEKRAKRAAVKYGDKVGLKEGNNAGLQKCKCSQGQVCG